MLSRQGQEQDIKARELVPGDIVVVEEGQTVPADARLICDYDAPEDFEKYKELREQHALNPEEDPTGSEDKEGEEGEGEGIPHQGHSIIAADQSAITGESLAVDKFMGDMVYYTTGCKRGKAYAVVETSARFSFVGPHCNSCTRRQGPGSFQGYHEQHRYFSSGPRHVLDSARLDWWLLPSFEHRNSLGFRDYPPPLCLDSIHHWRASRSASRHYHHPCCRSRVSRETAGYRPEIDSH